MHYFGVRDAHIRVYVGVDAVPNNKWTHVSWVDGWCVLNLLMLNVSEN